MLVCVHWGGWCLTCICLHAVYDGSHFLWCNVFIGCSFCVRCYCYLCCITSRRGILVGLSAYLQVILADCPLWGGTASAMMIVSSGGIIPQSLATEMAVSMLSPVMYTQHKSLHSHSFHFHIWLQLWFISILQMIIPLLPCNKNGEQCSLIYEACKTQNRAETQTRFLFGFFSRSLTDLPSLKPEDLLELIPLQQ